jgi:hypothetical protein
MISEPKHKRSGRALSDWISTLPKAYELDDDVGIGLTTIVQTGKYDFGLEGAALIDFIRRSLRTLVEQGARPSHWRAPEGIPLHYGNDSPEEIVEGVIADWLASGGGDLEWGDFRFTLPKYDALYDKRRLGRP